MPVTLRDRDISLVQFKARSTLATIEATLSKQQATLLPIASTLLLVWRGLKRLLKTLFFI